GAIDVGLGAAGDGGDGGTAAGVFHRQGVARRTVHPGTVDQHTHMARLAGGGGASLFGYRHGRGSSAVRLGLCYSGYSHAVAGGPDGWSDSDCLVAVSAVSGCWDGGQSAG